MSTVTAPLHDGTEIAVTVTGAGPAVMLPVRTEPYDAATAETMRQWGADPDLGRTLADGLSDRYLVIAADYEGHRLAHPAPDTLTPENLAADLLAIADVAGAERFAYCGYSWLALAGLQLAIRTERLSALIMGGYPPIDGPYRSMLAVTRAAHALAVSPPKEQLAADAIEPGDWDAVGVQADPAQTKQFVTLYEALQDFRDDEAQKSLTMPRLVFAGSEDNIEYSERWGDTTVAIAEPLARHRAVLVSDGWDVELLPGLDHLSAMHGRVALPLIRTWLDNVVEVAWTMEKTTDTAITITPANDASADDLQAVFGSRGYPSTCQCQWFKIRDSEWRSVPVEERKQRLHEQTGCGDPGARATSGLVAYLDGEPVGWCAVEPRTAYLRLARMRVPWADRNEDKADDGVWAVTCFVTRVGFRKRGVSRALARATVEFARERGARAIEGYPMLNEPGKEFTWGELFVGSRSVFADAGFTEVSRPTLRRCVMRIDF